MAGEATYRYFLVYIAFTADDSKVTGSREMVLNQPITGIVDIRKLEDEIAADHDYEGAIITNWQRFTDQ